MLKQTIPNHPKIGLALSGGTALGIAHIGVLQALRDQNISISCVTGTSAGSVVAACAAFGLPLEQMAERAKNLSWYTLSKFSYSGMGLISTSGVGKLIEEVIGKVNIEDAKIPLAIVATNIQTGEPVVFTKGSVAQAVMASVSLPGLFAPVEINGIQMVDGGLVENLPLSPLKKMGAEVEIGVNLARWRSYKKPGNALDVILNTFDIMTHRQSNAMAKNADVLIEPRLEAFTASDFKKAAELIAEGYRAATLAMPNIQTALTGVGVLPGAPAAKKLTLWQRFVLWLKGGK